MTSSPSFRPSTTSMSVVPVIPVLTVTHNAFLFLMTNTPCTSSPSSFFDPNAVSRPLGRVSQLHIHNVRFIPLPFRLNPRHVGDRHQGATQSVLDSNHHRLTFSYRQVGDHAVVRCVVRGLLQYIADPRQSCAGLRYMFARGIVLRLRLSHARLRLHQSRIGRGPRVPAAVKIGLCDQAIFEQTLRS